MKGKLEKDGSLNFRTMKTKKPTPCLQHTIDSYVIVLETKKLQNDATTATAAIFKAEFNTKEVTIKVTQ